MDKLAFIAVIGTLANVCNTVVFQFDKLAVESHMTVMMGCSYTPAATQL
jgi:hypothetical protein